MDMLIDFLKLRADIYNLLSVVFYKELDEKHVENLNKYIPVLKEYASQCGYDGILESVNMLDNYLVSGPDYEAEACEFARLFLGVAKAATGHTITPHESVYLSPDRQVMQKPWEEMRKIYYDAGVVKDQKFMEPEDHITAEMSYMAHMSRKMADSILSGESGVAEARLQAEFLKNHIERWLSLLTADIFITSSSEYFKAAAKVAEQYAMHDRKTMEVFIEDNSI